MAELVANCPRCGTERITFDVTAVQLVGMRYNWQHWYEAFGICRNCSRSTIFLISEVPSHHEIDLFRKTSPLKVSGSLNNYFEVDGFIGLKDRARFVPPQYVPENIANVFREGATCLAVECWNAAGTMFRMCVDLATEPMLPEEAPGLSPKIRRDLGLRLPWLFENGILPDDLRELSTCIREDGNDAAHRGSLTKQDAEDLLDLTPALLQRLFTEPKRLEIARERREKRRSPRDA
jgi:hypothetical protein